MQRRRDSDAETQRFFRLDQIPLFCICIFCWWYARRKAVLTLYFFTRVLYDLKPLPRGAGSQKGVLFLVKRRDLLR